MIAAIFTVTTVLLPITSALATSATLVLTVPPTATITQSALVPETSGGAPTGGNAAVAAAIVGLTAIPVTLQNTGDATSANVRISPIGAGLNIQLWAIDTSGDWYDINVAGWGQGGFQVPFTSSPITTKVYAISDTTGDYSLTVNLVNVSDSLPAATPVTGTVTVVPAGSLAAAEFGVMNFSNVLGYDAGFVVSSDADASQYQSIVVKLYSGATLLQTDTADTTKFIGTKSFSAPFDVNGTFGYTADGYWANVRGTEYGKNLIPTRVVATVTLGNGKVLEATNTTLTGDTTLVVLPGSPAATVTLPPTASLVAKVAVQGNVLGATIAALAKTLNDNKAQAETAAPVSDTAGQVKGDSTVKAKTPAVHIATTDEPKTESIMNSALAWSIIPLLVIMFFVFWSIFGGRSGRRHRRN